MKHSPLLIGLALTVVSALATAAQRDCPPSADEAAAADRARERLRAAMPELIRQYQVAGAAVALVDNGRPSWRAGFGWADRERRLPVWPETLFQAGTLSQPVSAWLFLKMVEDGRVALDAPVEKYLRGWDLPSASFDVDQVTLRRVLSHTAGLPIPQYRGLPVEGRAQSLKQSLAGADDAGGVALSVAAEPGAGFAFSSGGFALAQYLQRQVLNDLFPSVVQRWVLERLDMASSSFPEEPSPSPPLARTYDDAGGEAQARRFVAQAAAGLQTSVSDLARFAAGLMRGPCDEPAGRKVIKPETVAEMLTPQPGSGNALLFAGSEFGLGMALKRLPESGRLLAYHPGDSQPNWHGLIAAIPDRQSALVLLTNASGGEPMRLVVVCTWLDALGEGLPEECAKAVHRPESALVTRLATSGR
jgi:CubicO group peptidase (beta-lactamase class C family)